MRIEQNPMHTCIDAHLLSGEFRCLVISGVWCAQLSSEINCLVSSAQACYRN
jgi:hypothetical protein